jgi:hypothetical protein
LCFDHEDICFVSDFLYIILYNKTLLKYIKKHCKDSIVLKNLAAGLVIICTTDYSAPNGNKHSQNLIYSSVISITRKEDISHLLDIRKWTYHQKRRFKKEDISVAKIM